MNIASRVLLTGVVALALSLSVMGCGGSDGPKLYSVSGTVTFDDKPVDEGQIIFMSDEPGGTPDAGPIKNGKFSLQARAGQKRVEVTAMREVPGETVPDPVSGTRPLLRSYIPEQYNTNSELKAEVTAKGKNQFDFKLTDKK